MYTRKKKRGAGMRAREIMNRELVTIGVKDSVRDAAGLMAAHKISGLPVLDEEGQLAGIISESDIIQQKALFANLDHWIGMESFLQRKKTLPENNDNGYLIDLSEHMDKKVEEVMTVKVVAAAPDTPLKEIAALMVNKKINRIPIVEGKKLVGIITRGDILKAVKQWF